MSHQTVIVPEQPTDRATAEQIAIHLKDLLDIPNALTGDDQVTFILSKGAKMVAADHIYAESISLIPSISDGLPGVTVSRLNPEPELILEAVIRATREHHRAELSARYGV